MNDSSLHRVAVADMPADLQSVWQRLNELTGEPSFVEVFANAPELLDFVMQKFYADIFFGGRVEQRYKQLMRLKLSLMHGCRTCNKQNVPGAREAGITDAEIAALDNWADGPFSDADKAVLEYAELLAIDNQSRRMDGAHCARLKAHFSDAQICELGVVGAVIAGMAKLSFVLDLVEQEDYCAFGGA